MFFKTLESNQQANVSNEIIAQNALKDSYDVRVNLSRYISLPLQLFSILISKIHPTTIRRKKIGNTHARTHILQRERLACILRKRDLPEFIYCLIT